jgi:tetratricopeptide (TPR) repeat protein
MMPAFPWQLKWSPDRRKPVHPFNREIRHTNVKDLPYYSPARPTMRTPPPSVPDAQASPRSFLRGNYGLMLRLGLAMLIVAVLYFYRLDAPLLWGDEADTGVEARAILQHGYPLAYDGRNVSLFDNGEQLNRDLICNKIPWIQYYIGAASLAIFGNSTFGLRLLFPLIGLLTFFPVYEILKSRVKLPVFTTLLVLAAPQVVLLQRNARYYPILIFVYALLVWHLSRNFKSRRNHFLSALVIMTVLFHVHQFAAACASVALIIFCLLYRRESLLSYFSACTLGAASWLAWSHYLGPSLGATKLSVATIQTDFGLWLRTFFLGLWAEIVDFDVVGCFPFLLWAVLLGTLCFINRKALRNLFREKLYAFVLLNILIQITATAAIFGYEDAAISSLVRYEPHLLMFALVITFMFLDTVIIRKSLYILASLVVISFNFLSFSYWLRPLARSIPASWLLPVYGDIFNPQQNAWGDVIDRLRNEPGQSGNRNDVLLIFPPWTSDIAIFYLGDCYLIHPFLGGAKTGKEGTQAFAALHRIVDQQSFDRLFSQPDWMVDINNDLETVPPGYHLTLSFPARQKKIDDGDRPELIRHTFRQSASAGDVRIFHLLADDEIARYQKVLATDPNDADALFHLGAAWSQKGRLPEAISLYEKALAINPNLAEAHVNLGMIYSKSGRRAEALSEYQAALKIDSGSAEAHNDAGVVLFNLGQTDQAIAQFQEALRLKPDFAEAQNNLNKVQGMTGQSHE